MKPTCLLLQSSQNICHGHWLSSSLSECIPSLKLQVLSLNMEDVASQSGEARNFKAVPSTCNCQSVPDLKTPQNIASNSTACPESSPPIHEDNALDTGANIPSKNMKFKYEAVVNEVSSGPYQIHDQNRTVLTHPAKSGSGVYIKRLAQERKRAAVQRERERVVASEEAAARRIDYLQASWIANTALAA